MKIAAYNYRDFDEAFFFNKFAQKYNVEIVPIREKQTVENAHLAKLHSYAYAHVSPPYEIYY